MKQRIILISYIILLTGCISNNPPTIQGALSVQFLDQESEKEVALRKPDNSIYAIKTPTNRIEHIYKQFKLDISEFEKLVYSPKKYDTKYGILANSVPKRITWEQLKPYLKERDEIYLLPGLDWGFVIIRNNHLFCMIITDHSY